MIVVGPHEKTGIGQHAMKYVKCSYLMECITN